MNHWSSAPVNPLISMIVLAAAASLGAQEAHAQDFESVLVAPDDADLNLGYAQAAVRQGELAIAASTLERILINDPERHSVRLFYAVVLFRLGDLQNAKDQLGQLETAPLTASQRAEAGSYSRRIEQAEQRAHVSGRLTAALNYEEDAAGAYQTAFDLIGSPAEEDGLSSDVTLTLDAARTFDRTRTWEVYASALLHDHAALSGAAVDYQRGDAEIGFRHSGGLLEAQLGVMAHHVRLQGEPQLTEVGIRGATRYRATNALTLSARFEVADQSYDEPGIDGIAPVLGGDRDGVRYLAGIGASLDATARTTLSGTADYTLKTAGYDPFGYEGWRLGVALHQRFDRGVYALASTSVRWLDYDGPDSFFLSGSVREDIRTMSRIAVGAPLGAFVSGGVIGDFRDRVALELAGTHASRDSGPPLADFDSLGAELRLIWRFGSRR